MQRIALVALRAVRWGCGGYGQGGRVAPALTVSAGRDIPGHTGTYRDIPGHTGTYRDMPGHTGTYRDIPGHTGTYRDIPGHTGTYRDRFCASRTCPAAASATARRRRVAPPARSGAVTRGGEQSAVAAHS